MSNDKKCEQECVGHDVDKVRLITYPVGTPKKSVVIEDLLSDIEFVSVPKEEMEKLAAEGDKSESICGCFGGGEDFKPDPNYKAPEYTRITVPMCFYAFKDYVPPTRWKRLKTWAWYKLILLKKLFGVYRY